MTQDNLSEFARLCALLGETFTKEVNSTLIEIYFRTLKNFTIQQVSAAVEQVIATKNTLFPYTTLFRSRKSVV